MDILIISPAFAPYSGVGANRMVSLSTFLCGKGHNVTVLRTISSDDESVNTAIEPVDITYVDIAVKNDSDFESMSDLYSSCVTNLVAKHVFQCVIVSVGPFYTYGCIPLIRHTPIIMDFRDLFVYERPRHDDFFRSLRRLVYHKKYHGVEKAAVASSKAIVTVVPDDERIMRTHYSGNALTFQTIFNGYDSRRIRDDDISDLFSFDPDVFYIGIFGKMAEYNKNLCRALLAAVSNVRKNGIKVVLLHIGAKEDFTMEQAEQFGIRDIYCEIGQLEYSKGMNLLKHVNALSIVYSSKTGYGTKIYDYIYLNKPVLLMSSKNTELAKIVKRFENGYVCHSAYEYEKKLQKLTSERPHYLGDGQKIAEYARDRQNAKYEMLIDDIVCGNER